MHRSFIMQKQYRVQSIELPRQWKSCKLAPAAAYLLSVSGACSHQPGIGYPSAERCGTCPGEDCDTLGSHDLPHHLPFQVGSFWGRKTRGLRPTAHGCAPPAPRPGQQAPVFELAFKNDADRCLPGLHFFHGTWISSECTSGTEPTSTASRQQCSPNYGNVALGTVVLVFNSMQLPCSFHQSFT